MALEEKVYAALAGDATLAALVGTRITPVRFDQGSTWPAVEYSTVSGNPAENLDGGSDKRRYRMAFDCRARTYAEMHTVAEAVEAVLRAATSFKSTILSINDFPFESGAEVHRRTIDASVWGTA